MWWPGPRSVAVSPEVGWVRTEAGRRAPPPPHECIVYEDELSKQKFIVYKLIIKLNSCSLHHTWSRFDYIFYGTFSYTCGTINLISTWNKCMRTNLYTGETKYYTEGTNSYTGGTIHFYAGGTKCYTWGTSFYTGETYFYTDETNHFYAIEQDAIQKVEQIFIRVEWNKMLHRMNKFLYRWNNSFLWRWSIILYRRNNSIHPFRATFVPFVYIFCSICVKFCSITKMICVDVKMNKLFHPYKNNISKKIV